MAAKNVEKKVTLRLSSNIIDNTSNDNTTDNTTSFLHELLPLDTQVAKLLEAFANNRSVNIYFSKTQISKIIQLDCFLFMGN